MAGKEVTVVDAQQDFDINQDVNASSYTSNQTELRVGKELSYGLSGAGGFTLTVKWVNGLGTVLFTETDSSSDGSAISGNFSKKSDNVIIEITDDSGATNTVQGTVNIH